MRPQPLFKRRFEPIAGMGSIVALRNADGFITDQNDCPFYQITHIESQMGIGPKGTVVIWSHTASPADPYAPDKNAQVGQQLGVDIPAGSSLAPLVADFLTLQALQFGQWRFLLREVPDSDGLLPVQAINDFDLAVDIPQAQRRGGTQRISGFSNAMFQGSLASDAEPAAAQSANVGAPVGTYGIDPFDLAARGELFSYGGVNQGTGALSLKNNGAAATSRGAVGLNIGLFLYNVTPMRAGATGRRDRVLGYDVTVPAGVNLDEVILVPVQGQLTPKS